MSPMQIDALSLLIVTACTLIVVTEDRTIGFFSRAATSTAGFLSFAQAMWLLGVWIPNSVGYPWPRLALDSAFCLVAIMRTVAVLKDHYALRRRMHMMSHGH